MNKKIQVKPGKPSFSKNPIIEEFEKLKKDVNNLQITINKLYEDQKEEEHVGKDITLILINGEEVTAKLLRFGKFIIEVEEEGKRVSYFKHFIGNFVIAE